MKKMFKRTAAIAVSAFMAAQYIPFTTVAEGSNTLYIHPYVISSSDYTTAKTSGYDPTGTTVDFTEANKYDGAANSLTFKIDQVTASGALNNGAGFPKTGQTANTAITLENGYYKITPENNDTDDNYRNAEAFYIQLPSKSEPLHIYPKFTDNDDGKPSNDSTDPEDKTDPDNPVITDDHAIKLNKILSDDAAWSTTTAAVFTVYYQDSLGNWITAGTKSTTNGTLIIDGLPFGTYYLVETSAPNGYMLDQTPQKFVLDGSKTLNNQVKDFTNDKPLQVTKVIDKDGKGHTFNWTIEADLPTNRKNLLSYVITDTYNNTELNVANTSDVTIPALDADDYTVTKSAPDAQGKVTITITIEDLAALAGISGDTIDVKVVSTLADGFTSGSTATNNARITYQYAYDPDPSDDIPDDVPGITDPTPTAEPPVPAPVSYPAVDSDPVPAVVTPATIYFSNVWIDDPANPKAELTGGVYNVPNGSKHNDITDSNDSNFKLAVAYNLAPGKYTITQEGTQDGYQVAAPIDIYIDTDGKAYLYDGTKSDYKGTSLYDTTAGRNILVFENTKITAGFNLPFTGTTATIVFTITGILLMAGTGFLIFILIKKRDDEDEDEEQVNN